VLLVSEGGDHSKEHPEKDQASAGDVSGPEVRREELLQLVHPTDTLLSELEMVVPDLRFQVTRALLSVDVRFMPAISSVRKPMTIQTEAARTMPRARTMV